MVNEIRVLFRERFVGVEYEREGFDLPGWCRQRWAREDKSSRKLRGGFGRIGCYCAQARVKYVGFVQEDHEERAHSGLELCFRQNALLVGPEARVGKNILRGGALGQTGVEVRTHKDSS